MRLHDLNVGDLADIRLPPHSLLSPPLAAGTKLTEMELPEAKVLEKLNTVSTAKRLANMVRHPTLATHSAPDVIAVHGRNCTTRTSASAKRSTRSSVRSAQPTFAARIPAICSLE